MPPLLLLLDFFHLFLSISIAASSFVIHFSRFFFYCSTRFVPSFVQCNCTWQQISIVIYSEWLSSISMTTTTNKHHIFPFSFFFLYFFFFFFDFFFVELIVVPPRQPIHVEQPFETFPLQSRRPKRTTNRLIDRPTDPNETKIISECEPSNFLSILLKHCVNH